MLRDTNETSARSGLFRTNIVVDFNEVSTTGSENYELLCINYVSEKYAGLKIYYDDKDRDSDYES